jgi:hypothetical protein
VASVRACCITVNDALSSESRFPRVLTDLLRTVMSYAALSNA